MPETDIVKHDQGGVNARILARENKADFRRVEAASIKLKASFASAEGKRMFVRYFSTLQLSAHFISVIARTRLDHAQVAQVETVIRDQMDKAAEALNRAIDGAEALFGAHGITSPATYDTVPLEIEVGILSSYGRRYLELLGKLDQLMPLLQTLEIHEVVTTQAVDIERAGLKRKVRDVANGARSLATRMRRAMNALDVQKQGALVDAEKVDHLAPHASNIAERASVEGEALAGEGRFEEMGTVGVVAEAEVPRASAENDIGFQGRDDRAAGAGTAESVG